MIDHNNKNKKSKKKDIIISVNSIHTDIAKDNKNGNNYSKFRQNKSSSKVQRHTINLENKYKSPTQIKKIEFEKTMNKDNNEIKKVKTFLEGKNHHNNKLNEILNNKDNPKIKFMKSKDNVRYFLKNK